MGSLINGSPDLAAFDGQVFKKGLDLRRCKIQNDPGYRVADANATIRAGQLVSQNSGGFLVPANLTDVVAVAKWNKQQLGTSVIVDKPLTVVFGGVSGLGRGSVSNVVIRSATGMGGVVVAAASNYTLDSTNGTVTWANPTAGTNAPANGATVYATFTFALVDADFDIDGREFRNQNNNDVAGQENRLTIIQDWAQLYDIEWDTTRTYAMTGASSKLYCNATGQFSNDSGGGAEFMGKVMQLPTALDPYMGIIAHGNPV